MNRVVAMVSIRKKTMLFFLAIMTVSVFIAAMLFFRTELQIENQAKQELFLLVQKNGLEINMENKVVETAVDSICHSIVGTFDLNRSLEDPESYFDAYLPEIDPVIYSITNSTESSTGGYAYFNVDIYKDVYDIWYLLDGGSFTHSPGTETMDMFYPENENMIWYYGSMLSGNPFWTDIYYDAVLGANCVSYTQPLYKDGVLIGMAGMDTSFERRKSITESIKVFETGYVFIVDKEGNPIVNPKKEQSGTVREILLGEAARNESGVIEYGGDIISFMVLDNGNILSAVVPKSEVLAQSTDFRNSALAAGLLVMVFFAGLLYIFTGTISDPVKKLTGSVKEVAMGNLSADVAVESNDEVGELATSFNKMIHIMKDKDEKLKAYGESLQTQVEKRTYELDDKIEELTRTKTAMLNMMEDADETNKELTKARDELNENLEKLREMDKKKNEFISIAAHELKTPLTSIHGFSQLLQEESILKDEEKRSKFLRIIDKETKRLSRLVTDILDLSRIDMGTFRLNTGKIEPEKLLDDLYKEMSIQAREKNLKMVFDVEKNLPDIYSDKERLIEILMNLINNSIKYTPKGEILLRAYAEGGFVHFLIKDTGIGIAKENQPRIFQRFYQVDSSFTRNSGGTGLGLALSKEYVTAMGGRIWFSSEYGKGSEFHFTLPINNGKAQKIIT